MSTKTIHSLAQEYAITGKRLTKEGKGPKAIDAALDDLQSRALEAFRALEPRDITPQVRAALDVMGLQVSSVPETLAEDPPLAEPDLDVPDEADDE